MLPMLALIQSAPSPAALANDVAPRIAWSLRQSSSRKLFSPKLLRPSLNLVETTETYYSDPIRLEAGHMIFTDIERTPLAMPKGAYFVTEFFGDIVDADTHEPSPLDALYGQFPLLTAPLVSVVPCSSPYSPRLTMPPTSSCWSRSPLDRRGRQPQEPSVP